MTYKATQVYVVMRTDSITEVTLPVAVFDDLETAEGNADGYNLDMKERTIDNINFWVAATMRYE